MYQRDTGDDAMLRLLWRNRPAAARRYPTSTTTLVAEAAYAIADTRGLDQVTVRSVADHLDATFSQIYNTVPHHQFLLTLLRDHCYHQVTPPDPGAADPVSAIALAEYRDYIRRPWRLQLNLSTRPLLGPGRSHWYEVMLDALGEQPPGTDHRAIIDAVEALTIGAATPRTPALLATPSVTGLTGLEFRQSRRVAGLEPPRDDQEQFRFGLDLLIAAMRPAQLRSRQ